jgi:hypothetical protein
MRTSKGCHDTMTPHQDPCSITVIKSPFGEVIKRMSIPEKTIVVWLWAPRDRVPGGQHPQVSFLAMTHDPASSQDLAARRKKHAHAFLSFKGFQ